jgi:hypothetical protein
MQSYNSVILVFKDFEYSLKKIMFYLIIISIFMWVSLIPRNFFYWANLWYYLVVILNFFYRFLNNNFPFSLIQSFCCYLHSDASVLWLMSWEMQGKSFILSMKSINRGLHCFILPVPKMDQIYYACSQDVYQLKQFYHLPPLKN